MRVSDKAIVLQAVKHGDNSFILRLYTRNHGLISAAARTGKTASSKIRASNLMPLSLLDVEMIMKQNREIHPLTEVTCYYVTTGISGSIVRLSIAQFLNELLLKALKEQGANPHLYDFIQACLRVLNEAETCTNLHLYFLSELTKYLGFEPQNDHNPSRPYFDCREGRFSAVGLTMPLGLNQADSALFSAFLKEDLLQASLTHAQRQLLLEIWLAYYRLHIPGFGEVKSLGVLKEVLSA